MNCLNIMKASKNGRGCTSIRIIGCGKIGRNPVKQLNEQGNDVRVIGFSPRLDIMGFVGNGERTPFGKRLASPSLICLSL